MDSVTVALTHIVLALQYHFISEALVLSHASHLNLKEKCLSKPFF